MSTVGRRDRAVERTSEAGRSSWLTLAVLLIGQFMALLDVFVVNVAMPAVGADLHGSGAALQLVVGGYVSAYAMFLITGARLGDLYGRRRMYVVGVAIFTGASLMCGFAPGHRRPRRLPVRPGRRCGGHGAADPERDAGAVHRPSPSHGVGGLLASWICPDCSSARCRSC
jgi:MFS family permease